MNNTSQYSMLSSMEQALTGSPNLVDGRTEQDWLHFMARFSSLVNFYDQHNRPCGNWQPFVLKDPVILLATISKTSFGSYEKEYRYICTLLNRLVQRNDAASGGETLNSLFNFLTSVFLRIGEWVYYMQLTHEPYPLRTNVLRTVINRFGPAFRAMCSLRQNLFLSRSIKGIEPVNHNDLQLFDAGDNARLQPRNHQPYWELLELQYPLKNNTPEQLVQVLIKLGNELMQFFNSIITHAGEAFEQLQNRKSPFPDTLLLRAFVQQLGLYKDQMNGITQKHLWFNYKDILRLEEKPGVADSVYLCGTLTQKNQAFLLPAGTTFDAGADVNNNPVTFASSEPVWLNPATIASAYTMATIKGDDGRYRIYRQDIPSPATIQKNEAGNVLSWKTFGGDVSQTPVQQNSGILFASPLLLLREGERRITVTLRFATPVPVNSLNDVQYYLSTQKQWLPVTATGSVPDEEIQNGTVSNYSLLMILNEDQPPVEPFAKLPNGQGPNGLPTDWPMLKMEFASFTSTATPPVITRLKIEVIVRGVKTLELYNDFGALAPQSPFQPLGPTPMPGSNFIIGSSEVFSKPLNMLQMQLTFDKPPADFSVYYNEYNEYLYRKAENAQPPEEKKSLPGRVVSWVGDEVKKLGNWVRSLFKKETATDIVIICAPFSNTSFTTGFSKLEERTWSSINISKAQSLGTDPGVLTWQPYTADPGCACTVLEPGLQLFSTDGTNCTVQPDSFFVYDLSVAGTQPFQPDPQVQQNPFVFTSESSSGCIRMSLAGPDFGFGSAIYPEVVSDIALQNAWTLFSSKPAEDFIIFKEKTEKPKFIPAAALPYAPKLSGFVVHYSAAQEYDFVIPANNTYPVQCYLDTPVQTYKIFDSVTPLQPTNAAITLAGVVTNVIPAGIPLYQSVTSEGNLFIELSDLVPASELSFFAELAPSYNNVTDAPVFTFSYLSKTGWNNLPVLYNSTGNFSCSGLLRVNVPGDADNSGAQMPGNNYWMAISISTAPESAAETILLSANGFQVSRTSSLTTATVLPALTIKKTTQAVSQLASVVQPFASFGGKAPEQDNQMLLRVANRLYTKNRAVSAGDFYRLITERFSNINYSRAVLNNNNVTVYLVKNVATLNDASARLPRVSNCTVEAVQQYLQQRTSVQTQVNTANFNYQYVYLKATVTMKPGMAAAAVQQKLANVFTNWLMPWVNGNSGALPIEQPVTTAAAARVLQQAEGVALVSQLEFFTWKYEDGPVEPPASLTPVSEVLPFDESYLLVPAAGSNITCNPVA